MITEEYEDPNELNPLSFSQDGIDEEVVENSYLIYEIAIS